MEAELTEYQINVYNGRICPYCKSETKTVSEIDIYGRTYKGRKMICCVNYPTCDSYVGTHEEDDSSLGRLANKSLRKRKSEAHKYFDLLWKEKHFERTELYEALSDHLKTPRDYTHIGMFNDKTCKEVVDWSKKLLNDFRRQRLRRYLATSLEVYGFGN